MVILTNSPFPCPKRVLSARALTVLESRDRSSETGDIRHRIQSAIGNVRTTRLYIGEKHLLASAASF